MQQAPLLEVRNLRKWFDIRKGIIPRPVGHVRAVDDVSFTLRSHEVLGIGGESGSGKTTLGRAVLRLVEPTDGQILFNGENIVDYDRRQLHAFRRHAQLIFQDPYAALNPRMTIEQILAEPQIVQGTGRSRAERRQRSAELLEMVALPADYLQRMPHELSGGQRQRIVIARALAVNPQFVVADEPVSALDVSIQAQIIALLKDLRKRLGLSILFISHDLAVMEDLSDRIAIVYLGRLMEIGPAEVICSRPHHPYTRALLSAVPNPDPEARRERIILKGDLPDPANPPSGCVFRTRCPYAIPACAQAVPPMREKGPDHFSACIRDDI
ncbi:ABC transporter ATP-binding protein [Rhodoligotrophos defluvii]|uniref:ABC transporter ATP-binding protein n=1 Tax=Rhodoligotrophos defluvii TaxID=2561934 RepID=UPI0010C93B99|nr:ABC transporter ATP-binding protein [Rhodoligotrophos defluvii]